jgi:hypothetical protein
MMLVCWHDMLCLAACQQLLCTVTHTCTYLQPDDRYVLQSMSAYALLFCS